MVMAMKNKVKTTIIMAQIVATEPYDDRSDELGGAGGAVANNTVDVADVQLAAFGVGEVVTDESVVEAVPNGTAMEPVVTVEDSPSETERGGGAGGVSGGRDGGVELVGRTSRADSSLQVRTRDAAGGS